MFAGEIVSGYMVLDDRRKFSVNQKKEIWNKDNGVCGICWHKVNGPWHADHIIPWSLGGTTTVDNGQVAHPECNWEKSAREDFSNVSWNRNWRKWLKWL